MNDEWLQDPTLIKQCVVDYFVNLFTADDEGDLSLVPRDIFPKISMRECESLSKPFTKLEIDDVVQHLGSLKALGPDGYRSLF